MHSDTVGQRHHTQIAIQFGNEQPMTDTTIGLLLTPHRVEQGGLTPFHADIRAFGQDIVAEVTGSGDFSVHPGIVGCVRQKSSQEAISP